MYRGPEESPQYVLDHLDPSRIRLQRERAGITGKELAERIGRTPSAVSQIERGVIDPDIETLIRLGLALKVPVKFFLKRETNTKIRLDQCHFRANRGVPQYKRRQTIGDASILVQFTSELKEMGVQFPVERLSGFADIIGEVDEDTPVERMEEFAVKLREYWGMGMGPIPNLITLLESKGILVLPLPDSHAKVDAFSVWHEGCPVVLLTQQKAASRDRMDAAHELGHLAVHSDHEPDLQVFEKQAFRFGGAFLAPPDTFLPECPRRWSYAAFLQLKGRWRMSIKALVRRAYDLGCLSDSSYKRANIELNKRLKERGSERGEWEAERPTMIEQAVDLLKEDITLDSMAHEVGVHPPDLRKQLLKCINQSLLDELETSNPNADTPEQVVTLSRSTG